MFQRDKNIFLLQIVLQPTARVVVEEAYSRQREVAVARVHWIGEKIFNDQN